jgi:hypothetical protein
MNVADTHVASDNGRNKWLVVVINAARRDGALELKQKRKRGCEGIVEIVKRKGTR